MLRLEKGKFGFIDMYGARMAANQRLMCEMTVRDGKDRLRPERHLASRVDDAAEGLQCTGRSDGGTATQEVSGADPEAQ